MAGNYRSFNCLSNHGYQLSSHMIYCHRDNIYTYLIDINIQYEWICQKNNSKVLYKSKTHPCLKNPIKSTFNLTKKPAEKIEHPKATNLQKVVASGSQFCLNLRLQLHLPFVMTIAVEKQRHGTQLHQLLNTWWVGASQSPCCWQTNLGETTKKRGLYKNHIIIYNIYIILGKNAIPKHPPSNCCQRTNDIQVSSLTLPWIVKLWETGKCSTIPHHWLPSLQGGLRQFLQTCSKHVNANLTVLFLFNDFSDDPSLAKLRKQPEAQVIFVCYFASMQIPGT